MNADVTGILSSLITILIIVGTTFLHMEKEALLKGSQYILVDGKIGIESDMT